MGAVGAMETERADDDSEPDMMVGKEKRWDDFFVVCCLESAEFDE